MIANTTTTNDFAATLKYVFAKAKQVIYGNVVHTRSRDPQAIAIQMEREAVAYPSARMQKRGYHISLSPHQNDQISPVDWLSIARKFVQLLGADRHQVVAVLHDDTTYPNSDVPRVHAHFVINRLAFNSTLNLKFPQIEKAVRHLEQCYQLEAVPCSWDVRESRRQQQLLNTSPPSEVTPVVSLDESPFNPPVDSWQADAVSVAQPVRSTVTIVSGGQTGVGQGALTAAQQLGLPTTGVAPYGWLTEEGARPDLADYGLVECDRQAVVEALSHRLGQALSPELDDRSLQSLTDADGRNPYYSTVYQVRTAQNVAQSDGTLAVKSADVAEAQLALNLAREYGKPYLEIDAESLRNPEETGRLLRTWVETHQIQSLNVAGDRQSKSPGIAQRFGTVLQQAFAEPIAQAELAHSGLEPSDRSPPLSFSQAVAAARHPNVLPAAEPLATAVEAELVDDDSGPFNAALWNRVAGYVQRAATVVDRASSYINQTSPEIDGGTVIAVYGTALAATLHLASLIRAEDPDYAKALAQLADRFERIDQRLEAVDQTVTGDAVEQLADRFDQIDRRIQALDQDPLFLAEEIPPNAIEQVAQRFESIDERVGHLEANPIERPSRTSVESSTVPFESSTASSPSAQPVVEADASEWDGDVWADPPEMPINQSVEALNDASASTPPNAPNPDQDKAQATAAFQDAWSDAVGDRQQRLAQLEQAAGIEPEEFQRLRWDKTAPVKTQLAQLGAIAEQLEQRLTRVETYVADLKAARLESASSLSDSPQPDATDAQADEASIPVVITQDPDGQARTIAERLYNFVQARSEVTKESPTTPVQLSIGTVELMPNGAVNHLSFSTPDYGTKFSAVQVDGQWQSQSPEIDLSQAEVEKILSLPQTAEDYDRQIVGRAVTRQLYALRPQAFHDDQSFAWKDQGDTEQLYRFQVRSEPSGTKVLTGVRDGTDEVVLSAQFELTDNQLKVQQVDTLSLPPEPVNRLVTLETPQSLERQSSRSTQSRSKLRDFALE